VGVSCREGRWVDDGWTLARLGRRGMKHASILLAIVLIGLVVLVWNGLGASSPGSAAEDRPSCPVASPRSVVGLLQEADGAGVDVEGLRAVASGAVSAHSTVIVADDSKRPVPGARIVDVYGQREIGVTDPWGRLDFRTHEIASDRHGLAHLVISRPAYATARLQVASKPATYEVVLVARPRIELRVESTVRMPIAGATVELWSGRSPDRTRWDFAGRFESDASGRVALPHVLGSWGVVVSAARFVTREVVDHDVFEQDGHVQLAEWQGGTVTVLRQGMPVSGVTVRVSDVDARVGPPRHTSEVTGPDGTARFSQISEGIRVVSTRGPGILPAEQGVDPERLARGVRVEVEPGSALEVVLRPAQARASVEGYLVGLTGGALGEPPIVTSRVSDSDGRVLLEGLPQGRYVLRVRDAFGATSQERVVDVTNDTEQILLEVPGTWSVVFSWDDSELVSSMLLEVRKGGEIIRKDANNGSEQVLLESGGHEARLVTQLGAQAPWHACVVWEGSREFALTKPPMISARFRVTRDGIPASGESFVLTCSGGWWWAVASKDGVFEFDGIADHEELVLFVVHDVAGACEIYRGPAGEDVAVGYRTGRLMGTVAPWGDANVVQADLLVRRARGKGAPPLPLREDAVRIGDEGRFEVSLPEGTYRLQPKPGSSALAFEARDVTLSRSGATVDVLAYRKSVVRLASSLVDRAVYAELVVVGSGESWATTWRFSDREPPVTFVPPGELSFRIVGRDGQVLAMGAAEAMVGGTVVLQ
jgi:hypothetical protein